jgi:hypothetical protein
MGRALRSAVLILGAVLLVGCAPSPALPDRSASDVVFDGRSIRYVVGDLRNGPTVVTVDEGGLSKVGL